MITENILLTEDFSWTDIEHPLRQDCSFISAEYKLSPLLVQNCIQPQQLPKYEKTPEGHFFLLRVFDPRQQSEVISIPNISNKLAIFIYDSTVVTIHNEVVYPLKKYLELKGSLGIPEDSRLLTHQLLRLCILSFEAALENLLRDYEVFEREIISEENLLLSNKKVYEFRRRVFVLKGVLNMTLRTINNSKDFWKETIHLQQDIKEAIDLLNFQLEGLSLNFDQLLSLYNSIYDRKNNEVMRILTVFASIMLPLTFISSFYGMNFRHLPGLESNEGFLGSLLIMVTITFMTVWFFIRKKWFKPSV